MATKGYNKDLENLFCEKLKNEIGEFKMDNLKMKMEKKFMA